MLEQRSLDLHSPRSADTGMRYVSIAADLVGRVDDGDALTQLIRQQPGALAEQLARIRALVKRAREAGGQRSRQQLDLLIPPGAACRLLALGSHPNDGTSPFSATGTLSASSLTRSICVRRTLNPRPLRASIMWES